MSSTELPVVELSIEGAAHGGHCVARYEGRVVFVRHTAPGERVLAALTQAKPKDSFWRADALDVLEAHSGRVPSAWPAAGVGGVGGGELAHLDAATQLQWKSDVLAEQLQRLGGVSQHVAVRSVPGVDPLAGYRTRIECKSDNRGQLGMNGFRSRRVIPLTSMPLATAEVQELGLFEKRWPRRAEVKVIVPVGGDRPLILVDGVPWRNSGVDNRPSARRTVIERVDVPVVGELRSYQFKVAGAGFWQVHHRAPSLLAERTVALLAEHFGDLGGARVADLYSGAGLLSAPLVDLVGDQGQVVSVESDQTAVRDARRSLPKGAPVEFLTGDVADVMASDDFPTSVDAVVLDPPRVGAGREVVELVGQHKAQTVVYLACDPAALARDVAYFAGVGYELKHVEAWDVFPHTHHFESIAVFSRG